MKKIIGLLGCGVILATSSTYGAVFFYQEPGQYVMAQAKPDPQVKPVLDISGIKEIQSIRMGEMRSYWTKDFIDEGEIPMELILNSIANLAIMQMGLEKFVIVSSNPGKGIMVEGEFGKALQEILGVLPEEVSLTVEHTDFMQTDLGKEDYYRLTINCRDIDLILLDFGIPDYLQKEYGYDWGIRGLTLTQYSEKRDARGIPYTEERELDIHQVEDKRNPGRYKFMAIYTVRTLAPDGTVVEWEEWEFAQGSPNAISYRKIK
jgi:hypothetical protein